MRLTCTNGRVFRALLLAGALAVASGSARSEAPPGAAVTADSLLLLGAGFEDAWNRLLCEELQATLRDARAARELRAAETEIAAREPAKLGSHIAADALRLRSRWRPDQLRLRVAAMQAETVAVRVRGSDPARAESLYAVALTSYRALGERRREAWVLGGLGVAAVGRGDYAAADSIHRLSLAAREAVGDDRMIGNSLNDLGAIALKRQRWQEGRAFLERSRSVREHTGQPAQLGSTLGLLGNALAALGERDSAVVVMRRGVNLASAAADSGRTRAVLLDLAAVLVEADRVDEVGAVLDRAGKMPGLSSLDQGRIEFERGRAALKSARYATAAAHLAAASDWFGDDPGRRASALVQLGAAWVRAEEPERARAALIEADSLIDPEDHALRARAYNNLAAAAQQLERSSDADSLARQALAEAETAGDSLAIHDALVKLGEIALDRGDLPVAQRWMERGLGYLPPDAVDQSLADHLNLAAARIRAGHLDVAEQDLHAVLAEARARSFPDLASMALVNLSDVAERRGDYVRALAFNREALALADTVRGRQSAERTAIRVFAGRVDAFDAMIHLLGRLDPMMPDSGFAAEAFLWAERSRARSLMDREIERSPAGYAFAPLPIARVQALLGPRQALLEYSVGDSSTSLWVVRRDRWIRCSLPAFRQLRVSVEAYRQALTDPRQRLVGSVADVGHRLHRMLVEPAGPALGGIDHLVIVPDGPLAQIPFEALELPGATRYLIERYRVSYLASASMLARPEGAACSGRVIAVGAPAFGAPDSTAKPEPVIAAVRGFPLTALPHTAEEVRALERLAPAHSVVTLTGAGATRSALLGCPDLPRASIIHLATHGESDELAPERCRLWLAPEAAGEEASQLGLDDITSLRLCADQVTLAACRSGMGRLERGEGTIGLARAFLASGAQSVLASLWNVDDAATAALMRRFYAGLLQRGESRAQALATAKRELIRSPANSPFYWAAFQLIGESGPLAATGAPR